MGGKPRRKVEVEIDARVWVSYRVVVKHEEHRGSQTFRRLTEALRYAGECCALGHSVIMLKVQEQMMRRTKP